MSYTVKQLADLAGVSVRALHYYDEIGLLSPGRIEDNSYRCYEEQDLLRLQQILFFRELDFSLKDIKQILSSPSFDMREALLDQRSLIELKKKRLEGLIQTIDKTIKKIDMEANMEDKELYGGFTKDEMDKYTEEARGRWGDTEAFRESVSRVKKMGKEGLDQVMAENGMILDEIASQMSCDPKSEGVQNLIDRHYNSLRAFYEPNLELYRGLADLYVTDERFEAFFENIAEGLAHFMHDAMLHYVDMHE